MQENAQEDVPADGFLLSIEPEHGGTVLWIRDEVTGDPQTGRSRSSFVVRKPSTSRDAGAFNGPTHARGRASTPAVVARMCSISPTRETIAWTDTNGWLARTLASSRGKRGCAMSIPDHARANFQTLLRAAADGDLALMECSDAATGETRYVICAVGRDGTDFLLTPFGHLADGNPYDAYVPPAPNPAGRRKPPDRPRVVTCLDAAAHRVNGQAVSASSAMRDRRA